MPQNHWRRNAKPGFRNPAVTSNRLLQIISRGGGVGATYSTGLPWWMSDLAVAVVAILLTLILRLPSFLPSVIDPDESLYILQAREWLRGGWPYIAVWDMHPVGASALVAAAFSIFGESVATVRLLGAIAVAATAFLLFRTVVAARGERVTGIAACALYIGHSLLPGGLATNTEIMMAPLLTAGWLLTVIAARNMLDKRQAPSLLTTFILACCFGLALWVKQVVAPIACMAFLVLVSVGSVQRLMSFNAVFRHAAIFAFGCALPMLATGLVYASRGTFEDFIEGNLLAPMRYAGNTDAFDLTSLRLIFASVLQVAWLMILSALSFTLVMRRYLVSTSKRAVLLPNIAISWFVGAILSIVLPFKFFDHYFMLWLPPLCLMAAFSLRAMTDMVGRRPRSLMLTAVAFIGFSPALNDWSGRATNGFSIRLDDPTEVIAAAIKETLPSGEMAYIVNYEPVVYFLADLPLPTRLPFWQHLVGEYSNELGQDSDAELKRILQQRPAIIVISELNWGKVRPEAQHLIMEVLAANYGAPTKFDVTVDSVELWHRR